MASDLGYSAAVPAEWVGSRELSVYRPGFEQTTHVHVLLHPVEMNQDAITNNESAVSGGIEPFAVSGRSPL